MTHGRGHPILHSVGLASFIQHLAKIDDMNCHTSHPPGRYQLEQGCEGGKVWEGMQGVMNRIRGGDGGCGHKDGVEAMGRRYGRLGKTRQESRIQEGREV